MPVALEAEHRVDDVFEHPRPGEAAVFGDVADEHHRDAAALGLGNQAVGAAADLHDAAGRRAEVGVGDRLDAVDDDEVRLHRVEGGDDVGERRFGQQPHVGADRAEPFGAQPHLLGALLGADVQGASRPRRGQLQQQRALADAGFAGEQGDRPRHEAAAEHPVELVDAGRLRPTDQRLDLGDGHGGGCGSGGDQCGEIGIRGPRHLRPSSSRPRTTGNSRPTSGRRRNRTCSGRQGGASTWCLHRTKGVYRSSLGPGQAFRWRVRAAGARSRSAGGEFGSKVRWTGGKSAQHLVVQSRRASISPSSNSAEGSGRYGPACRRCVRTLWGCQKPAGSSAVCRRALGGADRTHTGPAG